MATGEIPLLCAPTMLVHGLTAAEAPRRLEHHGPNRLSQRCGRGPLLRFALQFHPLLIHLLLAATRHKGAP